MTTHTLNFFMITFLCFDIVVEATGSSTIPCPGVDNASNFSDIPLSQRPKLERILQHGFQPRLLTATLPSQQKQPPVSTYQGFADRPFRTLLTDNQQCRYSSNEAIRCVRSTMASFSSGPGIFAEKQVLLELGSSYDIGNVLITDNMVNSSSYATWADKVQTFFGTNLTECWSYSSSWLVGRTHSCSVAVSDCQMIDPEFKTDLASLPVEPRGNTIGVDLSQYQAFVDKWGHGTVDRFAFGFLEWQISLQTDQNRADLNVQDRPTLYMGRAGGTGNYTNGDYYTKDECNDPAPINLRYRSWDLILKDMFRWDNDPTILALDLDAIGDNFLALRRTYPLLFQQLRDQGLTNINCPTTQTESPITLSPTGPPSDNPSTYMTQPPSSRGGSSSPSPSLRAFTLAPTDIPSEETSSGCRIHASTILVSLTAGLAHVLFS